MRDREALVAQLVRLVDWLDACPEEHQHRTLEIEIGVEIDVRASVRLHAGWLTRTRDGQPVNEDEEDGQLGGRTYATEAATVRDALLALRVPRARRRSR